MLKENSIILNHYLEYENSLKELDASFIDSKVIYYREGMVEDLLSSSVKSKGVIQTKLIEEAISHLEDSFIDLQDMEKFFSSVYNYPKLSTMMITTSIHSINVYEKLRPQYLSSFIIEMGQVVDGYLKGGLTKDAIKNRYLSDEYLVNCKKKMVKTSLDYDLPVKSLYKYDTRTTVNVNSQYISNNILPFIRNMPVVLDELKTTKNIINDMILDGYNDLGIYMEVIHKMKTDGNLSIDKYIRVQNILYKQMRMFLDLTSFLTFIFIKRINNISYNIRSYQDLRFKMTNLFPEGDLVLHESVLDGKLTDIDNMDLITSVLRNDSSIFDSVISSIVNKARSDMDFATPGISSSVRNYAEYDYNAVIYDTFVRLFDGIGSAADKIRLHGNDEGVDTEDILDNAGIGSNLSSKYAKLIGLSSNVNYYEKLIAENTDVLSKAEIYGMMLHELSDSRHRIGPIITSIYKANKEFVDLKEDLEIADPTVFHNALRVKELREKMVEFDSDFRQLILSTINGFLKRISLISDLLHEIGDEIFQNPDINSFNEEMVGDLVDIDNFDLACMEAVISVDEELDQIFYTEKMKEFKQARYYYNTGMKLLYEDGENAATPEAAKKTVGERIRAIVDSIKKFFAPVRQVIDSIIEKQAANTLKWLDENEQNILSVNTAKYSVRVIPYENYFTIDKIKADMNALTNNIKGLTKDSLMKCKKQEDVVKLVFTFVEDINNHSTDFAKSIENYYSVKYDKLETKTYTAGSLKELLPKMIAFVRSYNNGFAKEIRDAMQKIEDAIEEKVNILGTGADAVNESVLYEAEGDAKPATQPAQSVPTKQNTTQQGQTKDPTKPEVVSNDNKQPVKASNQKPKSTGGDQIVSIAKWLSTSVQHYSRALASSTRDRNYDYIRSLKPLAGGNVERGTQTNQNQQTNNQQAQPAETQQTT